MAVPLELRCFCDKKPILALCGRDSSSGEPFVHVKAHRQQRVQAEVVITSGTARIRCRSCLRWHTVRIKRGDVDARPERLPDTIPLVS